MRVNAATPVTFSQTIGGTTSMILVFNRQGQLAKRITYANGGAPVEQNF